MDIKVQCKEARELLRDANKQEKVAISLRWPEEVMRENERLEAEKSELLNALKRLREDELFVDCPEQHREKRRLVLSQADALLSKHRS